MKTWDSEGGVRRGHLTGKTHANQTRITTRVYGDIWPFENTGRGLHQTKQYSYICPRGGGTSTFHINTDNANHLAFSFYFRPFFLFFLFFLFLHQFSHSQSRSVLGTSSLFFRKSKLPKILIATVLLNKWNLSTNAVTSLRLSGTSLTTSKKVNVFWNEGGFLWLETQRGGY